MATVEVSATNACLSECVITCMTASARTSIHLLLMRNSILISHAPRCQRRCRNCTALHCVLASARAQRACGVDLYFSNTGLVDLTGPD
jgi:hypothetical protein